MQLDIYGEVEDADYWERQNKSLDSSGDIKLLNGPLPHAQVNATLGANHIFVLPTRVKTLVTRYLNPGPPADHADQ